MSKAWTGQGQKGSRQGRASGFQPGTRRQSQVEIAGSVPGGHAVQAIGAADGRNLFTMDSADKLSS